jgi:hypothetical protein
MKNLIFLLCGLTLCFCLYQTKANGKQSVRALKNNHCNSNTFHPIKLTGAIGSIKTDSVTTDKLNFPMWCNLLEDKPRGWGMKR